MADVFISYKSDRRAAAHHLAQILTAYGYSVWYDYQLASGDDFAENIDKQLRAAKAVVVLWCARSVASVWVQHEARLAVKRGSYISTWIQKAPLPQDLSNLQTLDLTDWTGDPQSNTLNPLVTAVANKVRRKPALDFDALAGLTQTWKDFKSPRMLEFPEDGNELGKLDDSWTANPPTGVSEVQEKKGFDYAKGSAVATIVVAVVTTLAFALDLVPQSISPTQLPEGKSTKLTSPIIPNAPAAPIVAQDVASKENLDTTKAADLAEVNGIGAENNQPKLAYADEKSAFDAAKATRRIKPLVDFIKSYPKTSFYAEADDAAWASVERQNKLYGTPAALEAYLQGFALGKHRRKAEELLAERYYEDKDYARSLPLARRLCETDSAEGCYVFGSHAYFGRGLSIDESLAANAYELGCDEGSARACGKAGYIYLFGKGVDEDEVKAAKFLNKGCDGSIAEACYHLGRAYHLGYGVAIDYDAAFLYYRKSCLGGAPAGCNSLGYMYHEGKGIGRDYNSAIIYYRKACDSDVFVACSNLGLSYESGDGVTRDLAEAKRFFKKACDGNYKMACRYLADLEEN